MVEKFSDNYQIYQYIEWSSVCFFFLFHVDNKQMSITYIIFDFWIYEWSVVYNFVDIESREQTYYTQVLLFFSASRYKLQVCLIIKSLNSCWYRIFVCFLFYFAPFANQRKYVISISLSLYTKKKTHITRMSKWKRKNEIIFGPMIIICIWWWWWSFNISMDYAAAARLSATESIFN